VKGDKVSSQTERSISNVFNAIVDLALTLGVRSIKDLPACWEHQVDDEWFIAINGHDTEQRTTNGNRVLPFHCYIEYNGWPAGLITPYDGVIAAGSRANEDSFLAALESATTTARREAQG